MVWYGGRRGEKGNSPVYYWAIFYLEEGVGAVGREAVRADAEAAAEAEDVLLVLPPVLVGPAAPEEGLPHKPFQPPRLPHHSSSSSSIPAHHPLVSCIRIQPLQAAGLTALRATGRALGKGSEFLKLSPFLPPRIVLCLSVFRGSSSSMSVGREEGRGK